MRAPRNRAADRIGETASPRMTLRLAWFALSAGLLIGGFLLSFPFDFRAYRVVARIDPPVFEQVAQQFSFWGDYFPGSILVSVLFLIGGIVTQSRRARTAALASLLAATLAGLTLDVGRFSLGRPRPYATAAAAIHELGRKPEPSVPFGRTRPGNDLPDGFYGPLGIHMFQGFPSGHAASSTASASAVIPLVPELGIPLCLLAVGVCWSRMELRQHYLSDVTVGGIWGALWGLGFGRLLLRRLSLRSGTATAESVERI